MAFPEAENQKFLAVFPDIVSAVVTGTQFSMVPEIAARVKELLEYNSFGGNKTRGLMTVHAYLMLEKSENITEENMTKARILGWCVELTGLLILDDIADNSSTRRGRPCWYRRPDVGLLVLNDALLMLTIVFDLLRERFGERASYTEMLNVFNEALRHLCIGQYPTLSHSKDYSQFTMDNFKKAADFKLTYYTFKLPVLISLLLADKPYKNVFNNVEDILSQMGILLTIQNDYTDCFGDETIAGKVGNDIQEGKCTWLAVTALQRFNTGQRAEFEACYGSADETHVQRVKQLYRDVELPALYRETEQSTYNDIVNRVKALPVDNGVSSALLLKLLEMIYDTNKIRSRSPLSH